jgi:hypothetical protein
MTLKSKRSQSMQRRTAPTGAKRLMVGMEETNVADILDRVLDRGIVMEPASRVLLIGKNLRSLGARLVVDSMYVYS